MRLRYTLAVILFCIPVFTAAQGGHILKRNGDEISFSRLFLIIYDCKEDTWMEIRI